PGRQVLAHGGRVDRVRALLGDDVADEAALPVHGDGGGDGLGDAGPVPQGGLHLPQLDAVPGDLHLEVDAAQQFEAAVGPVAGQVAGAVHAVAGDAAERVRQEAVRGLAGRV